MSIDIDLHNCVVTLIAQDLALCRCSFILRSMTSTSEIHPKNFTIIKLYSLYRCLSIWTGLFTKTATELSVHLSGELLDVIIYRLWFQELAQNGPEPSGNWTGEGFQQVIGEYHNVHDQFSHHIESRMLSNEYTSSTTIWESHIHIQSITSEMGLVHGLTEQMNVQNILDHQADCQHCLVNGEPPRPSSFSTYVADSMYLTSWSTNEMYLQKIYSNNISCCFQSFIHRRRKLSTCSRIPQNSFRN